MDGRTDGRTDNVKTVYPPTNTVCGGYKYKSIGLMISEKKIFLCVYYCKSMGDYNPRGVANFDPRGMIGRIYVGYH